MSDQYEHSAAVQRLRRTLAAAVSGAHCDSVLMPEDVEDSKPPTVARQVAIGAVPTAAVTFALGEQHRFDIVGLAPVACAFLLLGLIARRGWDRRRCFPMLVGYYFGFTATVLLEPQPSASLQLVPSQNALGMDIGITQAVLLLVAAIAVLLVAVTFIANLDLRSFAGGFPQLFPAALVVLLIPLFTTELWRATRNMGWWQFPAFFAVILGPAWLLAWRQLRNGVDRAIDEVADELRGEAPNLPDAPHGDGSNADVALREAIAVRAWSSETVNRARTSLGSRFRTSTMLRLAPLTVLLLVFSTGFFYALAVLLVDGSVAGEWASAVGTRGPPAVARGGWEYVAVALVLGTAATASFLALLSTDPDKTANVTRTLVHDPIKRCLSSVLPYLALAAEPDPRPNDLPVRDASHSSNGDRDAVVVDPGVR